jgi:hypothetical protein
MPPNVDADDRGRKAMDEFFERVKDEGSALDVPSGGLLLSAIAVQLVATAVLAFAHQH